MATAVRMQVDRPTVLVDRDHLGQSRANLGTGRKVTEGNATGSRVGSQRHEEAVGIVEVAGRAGLAASRIYLDVHPHTLLGDGKQPGGTQFHQGLSL